VDLFDPKTKLHTSLPGKYRNGVVYNYMIGIPALLIDVRHSKTMVFKSKAPALLPWYSMANSPETCCNETR